MAQKNLATKNPATNRLWDAWLAAGIFCVTFLAYLPALRGDFIWNDSDYVTKPALQSLAGLGRIWTDLGATQQYYPALHSAFWLQHRLWGDNPLGYHVVTLLLHIGGALLFARCLRKLAVPGAYIAALLFALHPVHVQSVAWITEQKNTLSLVAYLASFLAYLHFDETRRPRMYFAALALFLLSLLCKTVTATLPAALLVVLWWRRGRLDGRRDVAPLVPWLALGAAAGIFVSWVERNYLGAQGADFDLSWLGRGLVAGRAVWFYLGKVVWPFGLNFVYPRWSVDAAVWWQWLFPLGGLAASAALWTVRRRTRAPLAVFLIFTGTLFPVLGFVNLYGALFSWVWDHWQYLADLAPLALAGAGLAHGGSWAAPRVRGLGPALLVALAALLGTLTWQRCGDFRNDEILYRTTIARNPGCWMAHDNLGVMFSVQPDRLAEAIAEFETALRIKSDVADPHYNLGTVLARLPGRMPEAITQLETALQISPHFVAAHLNLGNALARNPRRLPEAIAHYEAALRGSPDLPEAHSNLGNALARIPGRMPEALGHFEKALQLNPAYAIGHINLGNALARIPGRLPEAFSHFETALRLAPDLAIAHINWGHALAGIPGQETEAMAHFEAALKINPQLADAYDSWGVVLGNMAGHEAEALAKYDAALRLNPDHANAHANRGTLLEKIPGRLPEAVAEYEAAIRINPNLLEAHYNLANVLADIPERRPEAVAGFETVLRLNPALAVAHYQLGQLLLKFPGRQQEALVHFEEALRLRPDSTTARAMVERLKAGR